MSNDVKKYLKDNGPSRSKNIAAHLVKKGRTPDAARKTIQRAKAHKDISSLSQIALPHNESFLYLNKQFQSKRFWEALIDAFDETNSAYGRIIHSLAARGGVALKNRLPLFSGSPIALKNQTSSDKIYKRLEKIGMLQTHESDTMGKYVTFGASTPEQNQSNNLAGFKSRLVAEEVLLNGLRKWVRNFGLVSYHKVGISGVSDELPVFGQFNWNLVGPSYVHPIVEYKDGTPNNGYVVADLILNQSPLTEDHIRYFLDKCSIMRSRKSTRPFASMLVALSYTTEAVKLLKRNGIMVTDVSNLFGEDISAAIKELMKTLKNAAAVAVEEPERVGDLLDALARIEGSAHSMRGPFFEMIAAHFVSRENGGYLEIGKIVTTPKSERAEMDVFCQKPGNGEVYCVECKSTKPGGYVSLDEVKDWRTRQVPRFREWLISQNVFQNRPFRFEIWASNEFATDALEYLEKEKAKSKKYTLDYKQSQDVFDLAKKYENRLVDILNEHFWDSVFEEEIFA